MTDDAVVSLVIACGDRSLQRVKALIDGTVSIPNCRVTRKRLAPGEMLFRSFADPELNVAELSLSNYVSRCVQGDCPYVALPVYIERSFPHATLYTRTDRGISTPQALRGCRLGIAEYQHTINVWTRGMLEDDYGVRPSDVQWISVTQDTDGEHASLPTPPGVSITRLNAGKSLSELLEQGELDALISIQPPACFTRGAPKIGRLFPDPAAAATDYFRRTTVFPILHIIGIRPDLVAQHPGLVEKLTDAFAAARDLNVSAVATPAQNPSISDPRLFSYGLDAGNTKTLELFLKYHFNQGLSPRQLQVSELFAPAAQASPSK